MATTAEIVNEPTPQDIDRHIVLMAKLFAVSSGSDKDSLTEEFSRYMAAHTSMSADGQVSE